MRCLDRPDWPSLVRENPLAQALQGEFHSSNHGLCYDSIILCSVPCSARPQTYIENLELLVYWYPLSLLPSLLQFLPVVSKFSHPQKCCLGPDRSQRYHPFLLLITYTPLMPSCLGRCFYLSSAHPRARIARSVWRSCLPRPLQACDACFLGMRV